MADTPSEYLDDVPGDLDKVPVPKGFAIIRRIGHGSMANVYLARDTELKRLVALKVLGRALAEDEVSSRRFEREAHAAARISHPNVSHIYGIGRLENGVPYISMEYIEGRNLADIAESRGDFDLEFVLECLTQLASALAASHAQNVIHRDVKPANLLVEDGSGRVVLTDFGIAGIRETSSAAVTRLTRLGEQLGDPRYMSPEQHRGEAVTEQTDVYGFGVVAYELLANGDPFGLDSNQDIAMAHLRREPLDLRIVRPDVPAPLADMLRRCLSKRPEHRPDIHQVIRSLHADDEDDTVSSAPENAIGLFFHELKRRRVYQSAAAYLAAMVLILQTLDVILPATPLPDWVFVLIVTAFLSGFPVILVLAWVYDVRRGKVERTSTPDAGPRSWRMWLLQGLSLMFAVLLAAALGWWMLA
jgi:serine/threonine protein kinase